MAGANPGALIDTLEIEHSEGSEEEAIIYTEEKLFGAPIWVNNKIEHSEIDPEQKKKQMNLLKHILQWVMNHISSHTMALWMYIKMLM